MADIINFLEYKLQKKVKFLGNEGELANQILEVLGYNDKKISIPIIKIAKLLGLNVYRENFKDDEDIAGKIYVFKDNEEIDKIIAVNYKDSLFNQRIVIARMIACYLIDIVNNENYKNENLLVDSLDYFKMYDKYEEFMLNILAPNWLFIMQYNIAVRALVNKEIYLSRYFEVTEEFVERKIKSLTKN